MENLSGKVIMTDWRRSYIECKLAQSLKVKPIRLKH